MGLPGGFIETYLGYRIEIVRSQFRAHLEISSEEPLRAWFFQGVKPDLSDEALLNFALDFIRQLNEVA